jgi:AhpD family alkylhydroperoxidase
MEPSLAEIQRELPELANSFGALFLNVMKEGAVSTHNKELIALGIAVAVQCESCIRIHVEKCLAAGCRKNEILEAAAVAVMMHGGPAYTHLPIVLDGLKKAQKE